MHLCQPTLVSFLDAYNWQAGPHRMSFPYWWERPMGQHHCRHRPGTAAVGARGRRGGRGGEPGSQQLRHSDLLWLDLPLAGVWCPG
eukprot:624859-Pelagomonas_calceolata.AAC.8